MTTKTTERWTGHEIDDIRSGLEQALEALHTELAGVDSDIHTVLDETCSDVIDVATRRLELGSDLGQAENTQSILDQTQHVLDRLGDGLYGVCEECGGSIPKARMKAFPRATFCVPCLRASARP